MRVLRGFFQPWMGMALGGLMAVCLVEALAGTGWAGVRAGVGGALIGVVVLPMGIRIGLLLGAVLFGLHVRDVVFGAMRRVGSWKIRKVTITFRWLPVVLSCDIGPWRQPVVLRCWLAGLTSAIAGAGLVAAGWSQVTTSFGRGFVIASTPLMLYELWPRRAPLATSTGWLLFGLPRMPEPERTEFRAAAFASRAYEALRTGDMATSERYVDQLAEAHPKSSAAVSCRVALLEARGEYASAVAMLLDHLASAELGSREPPYLLAGMAGLALSAVEAGQLPAAEIVPIAKKAMADAITLGYPPFHLSGTRALLALVEGDADEAARLATLGADYSASVLSQADDLVTLARAHMARLDNAAAREALRQAEKLAAWWPRVRETHARLFLT